MKTFIATIGYTEWPIASAIIKHGLSKGDSIILFSPEKKDERSRIAVNEIKNFVSKFVPSVEVSEISVPTYTPVEGIVTIGKTIKKEIEQGRDLIVNLSGGMRILVVETLLALTLLRIGNLTLELQTEDKVDVQLPLLWSFLGKVSTQEEKILRSIGGYKSASLSSLSKATRLPITTVYRIVKRLEENGFLFSKKVGKERIVEITEKGRILMMLLEGS